MTAAQLSFGTPDARLCDYGTPRLGNPRPCDRPATHRAVCQQGPRSWPLHENPASIEGHRASIDCCLPHADYYAAAWAWPISAGWHTTDATWIEVLP